MRDIHEITAKLTKLRKEYQVRGMDLDPEPQAMLRGKIEILEWVFTSGTGTNIGVWIDQGT